MFQKLCACRLLGLGRWLDGVVVLFFCSGFWFLFFTSACELASGASVGCGLGTGAGVGEGSGVGMVRGSSSLDNHGIAVTTSAAAGLV